MDFLWQWVSMNNGFPLIMGFQLEKDPLDNTCSFIGHFPSQLISLCSGFEQAGQGDY